MADGLKRLGLSVSTADGQALGHVCGTLWSDASGAEIIGVTGESGAYIVAADPSELETGVIVRSTFDFVANGPSVAEVDQLLALGGLEAVVSRLDDYYRIGLTIPPGPPGRSTPTPDWLRDIIESDPAPSDDPPQSDS